MQIPKIIAAALLGMFPMKNWSDEGMWLLNDPPRELLRARHQFELTEGWLLNAMHASVRLNSGGSGGFVSEEGLLVTNHHVAADSIAKLSGPGRDLLRDGFLAASRADELKCPDLEINVLQEIVDVTGEVQSAVKAGLGGAEAFAARRAVMSRIEKESLDRTGLRSDVVTLYNGGVYHLYRYKKYTDVRLVFAPEKQIASFGGDVDNFEFPRMNLDVSFFRAYEGGVPARTPNFFRWSERGPGAGDLVFVTGHPGTTQRLETLARLEHRRDHTLPYALARVRHMEAALSQFSDRSVENRRQAATELYSYANSRKAFSGQYQGLMDPAILAQKKTSERALVEAAYSVQARERSAAADGHKAGRGVADEVQDALEAVSAIQAKWAGFEREHALFETGHAFSSVLFTIARHCVRMAEELPKKSPDRLREYRDSNLDSLKFQLFSPAPIYAGLERAKLAASLTFMAEQLGGGHPLVQLALGGKNPEARAAELVAGTKLADVAERRRRVEGGAGMPDDGADAMLALARRVDAESRRLRTRFETEVEEPERQAYAVLANARFLAFGRAVAPDATFTLRMAFGTVSGYDVEGERLHFHTTFGEMYERAERLGGRPPFDLPGRWIEGKAGLDLSTPFNFVSTSDTIGGNSGSPVLNRAGELVGVNFDRNRHGLVRNFVYSDVQARHIAVHSASVVEALRKLYPASPVLRELLRR